MVTWYKGTQKLENSEKYNISSVGLRHCLHINNCQASDQGNYRVVCGPHISNAKLAVSGKTVSCPSCSATSCRLLTVEPRWPHTLTSDLFQSLVCVDFFCFPSSFPLPLGDESKILPASVRISQLHLWSLLLAEQIQFTKCIRSTEVDERHSATFECELSFNNATVSWSKDSGQLTESPKYNFLTEGRRHFMTINNVTQQDEGLSRLTEG